MPRMQGSGSTRNLGTTIANRRNSFSALRQGRGSNRGSFFSHYGADLDEPENRDRLQNKLFTLEQELRQQKEGLIGDQTTRINQTHTILDGFDPRRHTQQSHSLQDMDRAADFLHEIDEKYARVMQDDEEDIKSYQLENRKFQMQVQNEQGEL